MKLLRLMAIGIVLLTLAALGVGAMLIAKLGPNAATGDGALAADALPIIYAAEILKLTTAACIMIAVGQISAPGARLAGWLSAMLLAASGLLGIAAIELGAPEIGAWANPAGIASMVALGAWAVMAAPRGWMRWVAILLLVAALASIVVLPIGMLAGLLAIAWWIGVALAAPRLANEAPTA